MKYCFVFVCQQGELEVKSLLLAASLKRFVRGDYECVAAIPQPASHWGQITQETADLLQHWNIRTIAITNPIDCTYPIGNKIACVDIETSADKIIFLDSDILCLQPWDLDKNPLFEPHALCCVKPADVATFTQETQNWQTIYDLFNLPLPKWRVVTTVSEQLTLPYFNAGVLIIDKQLGLGNRWTDVCRLIDVQPIPNKRPWLDQIGLPIALTQLQAMPQCLDERLNYPAHLKPLPADVPTLCHYHWASVIRREPRLNQTVNELAAQQPLLSQKLLSLSNWAQLLKPYQLHTFSRSPFTRSLVRRQHYFRRSSPNAHPSLLITGIPRSGTSYLCRLLHRLQDCVVINEPMQIFKPLIEETTPWQIAVFHQELRRDVLNGQAIENKLHHGEMIEDTAVIDTRELYIPKVSRQDFLLCTKNTLAYMGRLTQLKRVMPTALIVACIRHPIDTIASWKNTFTHLQSAKVTEFPVGHVQDKHLASWQREQLAEIAATENLAWKRALLWRYLANVLLANAHQITILPYETLVTNPKGQLYSLLRQIPDCPPLYSPQKILPSIVRHKRDILDDEDKRAIQVICGQVAMLFGYDCFNV